MKVLLLLLALCALPTHVADTAELTNPPRLADWLRLTKHDRRLVLFDKGVPFKEYRVALGANPIGNKIQEGDQRTPEGLYFIDSRNERSAYHLALHISYPNETDMLQALARGVSPGGMIMIHGTGETRRFLGRFHRFLDWTDGCIAVTDDEIEEIWQSVPDGTPIEIRS